MNSKSFDFTEGNIRKKMIWFSVPIFLGNLLQSSYQLIDSLWVGNLLGADALGAVTIAATVIFTILAFIIGMNNATLTILSQQRGKKDDQGLKESLNAFVFVLGILTLCLGFIGFFSSAGILRLLRTPEEIMPLATTYLQINFIGILFLFGYNFIGTVLRALGDSKSPVRFVVLAVVLNAILDPILISWFNLGIHGAAYATVISQGAAFIYGLVYSIYKGKIPFTLPYLPAKRYAKSVLKLGLPGGLQMIAVSSGMLVIMGIVASFGKEVIAGFGAAQRIDSLIMLPALTLGSAVNSMAGQNIGANLWHRVKEIAKEATILILILTLTINTIVFIGAPFFIRLFVNDPQTILFGASYLRIVVFFYPFLCINFILNGIMRASGAMFQVLLLNIISFWVLRYPLTYLFSAFLDAQGIGYGIGVSLMLSSLIAFLYYRYGKWQQAKLFDDEQSSSDNNQNPSPQSSSKHE